MVLNTILFYLNELKSTREKIKLFSLLHKHDNNMKKYLFFYFLSIGINNLYAQTLLQDCKNQQPISNAIIYNATNNQLLGATDQQGKIDLPSTITDIVLVHPEYGSIPTINQAVICMDELLNNIIIEVKADAKEELLAILKNTYAQYSVDPFKDQYYYYKGTVYENDTLGPIIAKEEGYFKNFTYYNTNYYLANQLAHYIKKIDIVVINFLTRSFLDHFFFSNKFEFKKLLKKVKKLKVKKMNKDYYVYDDNWDNYWLFEIDTTQKQVRKFIDTSVQANFLEYGEKILFKTKRKLIHRLIEVNYNLVGHQLQQKIELFDLYAFSNLDTKLAKYIIMKTVDQQDFIVEKTYSALQHIDLTVNKELEIEDLAKTIKEKK